MKNSEIKDDLDSFLFKNSCFKLYMYNRELLQILNQELYNNLDQVLAELNQDLSQIPNGE
jgi:NADPH-dependent 7-cyano-7-deazaguanine reductase QueF-like protein